MNYPKPKSRRYRYSQVTVTAEVDVEEVLADIDTEDLLEELRNRGVQSEDMDDNDIFMLDKSVIEPMFEEYILNKHSEKMDEMMRTFFYNVLGRIV